jgi:hypothetical protein
MMRLIIVALIGFLTLPLGLISSAHAQPLDRDDFVLPIATGFEGFPNHIQISTQYLPPEAGGLLFTTAGSSPQINSDFQMDYGPLANGNILATGTLLGSNQIELFFVNPMSTTAVGADIIFRNSFTTATLEVFDFAMVSLGSVITPPDMGDDDEVFLGFAAAGIHKAVFTFAPNDTFAGIDNLIWEQVPEPPGLALAALALIGAAIQRRDLRKSASAGVRSEASHAA